MMMMIIVLWHMVSTSKLSRINLFLNIPSSQQMTLAVMCIWQKDIVTFRANIKQSKISDVLSSHTKATIFQTGRAESKTTVTFIWKTAQIWHLKISDMPFLRRGGIKKFRCSMILHQRPVLGMTLSQFSAHIFITYFTIIQFNIISQLSLLELSQVVHDWPHTIEVQIQSQASLYQMFFFFF